MERFSHLVTQNMFHSFFFETQSWRMDMSLFMIEMFNFCIALISKVHGSLVAVIFIHSCLTSNYYIFNVIYVYYLPMSLKTFSQQAFDLVLSDAKKLLFLPEYKVVVFCAYYSMHWKFQVLQ